MKDDGRWTREDFDCGFGITDFGMVEQRMEAGKIRR
jgi:hypothetical protein